VEGHPHRVGVGRSGLPEAGRLGVVSDCRRHPGGLERIARLRLIRRRRDHYELYVNGKLAGSGGDIKAKTTAFEERKSHAITKFITPGETTHIAVRVYDWYGAGGLFRPVTIGSARIGSRNGFLK